MSFQAVGAVRAIRADSVPGGLDPTHKLILMIIADYVDPETGLAWPPTKTIARDACVSERTVQRGIKALIEKGLLKRSFRFHPISGHRITNSYEITLPHNGGGKTTLNGGTPSNGLEIDTHSVLYGDYGSEDSSSLFSDESLPKIQRWERSRKGNLSEREYLRYLAVDRWYRGILPKGSLGTVMEARPIIKKLVKRFQAQEIIKAWTEEMKEHHGIVSVELVRRKLLSQKSSSR